MGIGSAVLAALIGVAQLAPTPGFLASALTLGLSDHAHSVSVVSQGGHLHLVLAHPGENPHDAGGTPHPGHLPGVFSEGDHVFHITGDQATPSASRRPVVAPLAAALPAPSSRVAVAAAWLPHARAIAPQRPIVLRL